MARRKKKKKKESAAAKRRRAEKTIQRVRELMDGIRYATSTERAGLDQARARLRDVRSFMEKLGSPFVHKTDMLEIFKLFDDAMAIARHALISHGGDQDDGEWIRVRELVIELVDLVHRKQAEREALERWFHESEAKRLRGRGGAKKNRKKRR